MHLSDSEMGTKLLRVDHITQRPDKMAIIPKQLWRLISTIHCSEDPRAKHSLHASIMGPFLFGFTFKSSFPYDWIQFKLGRYLNFYIFFFFRRHHLGFVVVYAILLSFSSVIMKCAKRKKHIFIDFCPIMYLCSELFWNIKHLNYLCIFTSEISYIIFFKYQYFKI